MVGTNKNSETAFVILDQFTGGCNGSTAILGGVHLNGKQPFSWSWHLTMKTYQQEWSSCKTHISSMHPQKLYAVRHILLGRQTICLNSSSTRALARQPILPVWQCVCALFVLLFVLFHILVNEMIPFCVCKNVFLGRHNFLNLKNNYTSGTVGTWIVHRVKRPCPNTLNGTKKKVKILQLK